MKKHNFKISGHTTWIWTVFAGFTLFCLFAGHAIFKNTINLHEKMVLNSEIDALKTILEVKDKREKEHKDMITELNAENRDFYKELKREKKKVDKFEDQIDDISGVVEDLEKLQELEPVLLQKYSKVYFLNEHYTPEKLEKISARWVDDSRNSQYVDRRIENFLEDLLEDADDDGINLRIISAHRSFGEQQHLKNHYLVTYGSGANQFSADQGYSEHQLGTAVDFTTKELGGNFEQIGNTEAFQWLQENAHKYGFILSYPQGNQYYQYEPWHWRFVGEELARYLDKKDLNFYDVDQRTIDEYLINIFE